MDCTTTACSRICQPAAGRQNGEAARWPLKTMIDESVMMDSLPIACGKYTLRSCNREDLDRRSRWPSYPPPSDAFNFSQRDASRNQLDALFASRNADADRIDLAADAPGQPTIGYFSLREIDWQQGRIGNFGMRLHPDWCGKGIGTTLLSAIATWGFSHGFTALTLDVAPTNTRAIRCYEKVGFAKTGEMTRGTDRFILMELKKEERPTSASTVRFCRGGKTASEV